MPAAAIEVEEIVQEPTPPPQLLRTVIQRGKEFEVLEEGEASVETKRLKDDLSAMVSRIEVGHRNLVVRSFIRHGA